MDKGMHFYPKFFHCYEWNLGGGFFHGKKGLQ
jgi:hypothetical protein